MKALITAAQIKQAADRQQCTLCVEPGAIITPAAKDTARDSGVTIIVGSKSDPAGSDLRNDSYAAVDTNLIAQIVSEILLGVGRGGQSAQLVKEVDSGGMRLVRGNSVILEQFNTGNPNEHMKFRELISLRESGGLTAGLISLDNTLFTHQYRHDEVNYILEGNLSFGIDSIAYNAQAGDIIYIPAGSKVKFNALNTVRIFYAACPAYQTSALK